MNEASSKNKKMVTWTVSAILILSAMVVLSYKIGEKVGAAAYDQYEQQETN